MFKGMESHLSCAVSYQKIKFWSTVNWVKQCESHKYMDCSPTFGQEKIHLHAWRFATLIPFEVVCLWQNTLLPAVLPLFEAFLECLFANGVQLGHHVLYNVILWLKSSPFQLHFQVGEQPIIARSHVRRVGSLSNHRNVVFGQESLDQLWGMSWCVVTMQLPRSRCPQVWSLVLHSIMKATKDFQVVFVVNILTLWCILVMHHPTGVKENGQHHFDVAPHLRGHL